MEEKENYSGTVNNNTILLSFEGWIKYIEGFIRGLNTTKTVDAASVMDCVGEVLEYMNTLRKNLLTLLQHCEKVMEQNEILEAENKELRRLVQSKLEEKTKKKEKKVSEDDNGNEVSEL